MSDVRKSGAVLRVHPVQFYGTIIEDETNERFFFWADDLTEGPLPIKCSSVTFLISPRPPKPGKWRRAVDIHVSGNRLIAAGFRAVERSEGSAQ